MIYVFLADGFEEVEAITPIDYLRRCEELEVKTVGVTGKMVESSRKIAVLADLTVFDIDYEKLEMIILPGGMPGTINLEKSPEVIKAIHFCMEKNLPIAAICAAPSILGHLGYLKGKKATCAEGFSQELTGAEYTGEPVETDGNIITARGAGVANQFAFEIIEKLLSSDRVEKLKGSIRWAE